MKRLGIIGGLGPMATAYLMQQIINMTDASTDQDHIEMVVYNIPTIPDRTKFILGDSSDSPLPRMVSVAQDLQNCGCDCLAMPCITAHFFHDELEDAVSIPLIHGIFATGQYLAARHISRVGIMATDGTIASDLFKKSFSNFGIETIYPDEVHQKYIMDIIYNDVKASRPVEMNKFNESASALRLSGAEVIILGCTELSIVKRDENIGHGFLDVIDIIAKCSVEACGKLKEDYKELIS